MEGLVYTSPLLGGGVEFLPKVAHDLGVIVPIKFRQVSKWLPIERVVCEDLQLGVGDIPVLIRCAFMKHFLVLYDVANFVLAKMNE